MSGLRDRKKRQTRKRILEAAKKLFGDQGFRESTIEDIADEAEAGVGTVYNYFGSKNALLVGIWGDAVEGLLGRGDAVRATADAAKAVSDLLAVYASLGDLLGKRVMKELLAVSFTQPQDRMEELMGTEMKMVGQLSELLADLQSRGLVDSAIELEQAAILLYTSLTSLLLWYVNAPEMEMSTLLGMVRSQVQMIFSGLSPR